MTNTNVANNEIETYSALDVANYLVNLAIKNNKPLTQISILKLLYFANAAYLVVNKKPLITEKFEAWNFGPVLRDLYENHLRKYQATPIREILTKSNSQLSEDKEATDAIKTIYSIFGNLAPFQLVNKTHKFNGAWYNTYHTNSYSEISDEEIIREFTPLVGKQN